MRFGSDVAVMGEHANEASAAEHPVRGRGMWSWVVWTALLVAGLAVAVCGVAVDRAAPILKGRVIETLQARFHSRVELDEMRVSVLRGLEVSGEGLRIFAPQGEAAAGPLIAVAHFEFHTGFRGLFLKPMHVGVVRVTGMEVDVPSAGFRGTAPSGERAGAKSKIVVDEFVCDDSRVVIGAGKAGKDPKVFALRHLVLRDVGSAAAWSYDATLQNAVPRGEIHAVGEFGPWVEQGPGESAVTGRYTFEHAELNTIKGIGGVLSSVGEFGGKLNRIEVKGTADVPNFSLETAKHPMPLHTSFTRLWMGRAGTRSWSGWRRGWGERSLRVRGRW